SVASLQPQQSMTSIPSSPGPKRSGNTLKKWLTSPVRRLSSNSSVKKLPNKSKKGRDGRKTFDPESPKPGENENASQESADEKGRKDGLISSTLPSSGMQSGGEDEPDEESHTPLPPPMKIIENDSTQEEMVESKSSSLLAARQSSAEVPSAADLVSAIEKLVKSKMWRLTDDRKNILIGSFDATNPSLALTQRDLQSGSSASLRKSEEEKKAKALRGRMFVLNELVNTEKDYVRDLGIIVEGFMKKIKERGIPEDMEGKDKIVFGNIHQIYDWHRDFFQGELEKCLQEHERLAQLFIKHERRLHMYVLYCQNKPKSEYIVAEYDEYFEEVKLEINQRLNISDFLIKPIQRITKYQLLLKDFLKNTEKAGLDCSDIEKAVELMCLVPKRCNDMMNLGRLQGFEGKLTAQGKLLQQDTFYVTEQDSGVLSRSKERRVFLFEQMVIFSELLRKGSSTPGYQFKKSIKMSYLNMEENVENDPCKFTLTSRGSCERVTLQAANPEIKQAWVQDITQVLDTQRNFLNGFFSPLKKKKNDAGKMGQYTENASDWAEIQACGDANFPSFSGARQGVLLSLTAILALRRGTQRPQSILSLSSQREDFDSILSTTDLKGGGQKSLQTNMEVNTLTEYLASYSSVKERDTRYTRHIFGLKHKSLTGSFPFKDAVLNHENDMVIARLRCPFTSVVFCAAAGTVLEKYPSSSKPLQDGICYPMNVDPPVCPKWDSSVVSSSLSKKKKRENSQRNSLVQQAVEKTVFFRQNYFNEMGRCNGTSSMIAVQSYYAVKENEICINQGEVVQVLAVNQQNMFLVYRPANDHSPAAEGWIPGYVLGPLTKPSTDENDGSIKKSCSWHTLRMRKRVDKESSGKNETKVENGPRKPKDIKVPVKLLEPNVLYTVAPEFLVPLVDVTCVFGETVTLSCKACGRPKPTITWKGPDQTVLTNSNRCTISVSSYGHAAALRILGTLRTRDGWLACLSSNYLQVVSTSSGYRYVCSTMDGSSIPWKENFESVYAELSEIGRGRFSIVKKCVQKATRKEVAAKFISKKMKRKEQAAHEAAILQHLQHPQYLTIHDTYESATSYVLVLELLEDGRLLDYLMNHDELMEEKVAFYVRDILEALQYLHNCRVAHLDIKPENVLVNFRVPVPRVKLIDLGEAVQITVNCYVHQLLGNPEFAAPEVIQGSPVSLGTDIWSTGILTYVMLSGVSPFLDESFEETCMNICGLDFSFPDEYFCGVSHAARDFVRVVLQGDFRRRPTAATCLQHPWLQPHNGGYSKIPLDTSRLASFIERRKHQNDARPITNFKSLVAKSRRVLMKA
uniref:Kalirin RhoGEF kinase n=1 Tax=Latimeria chalumnae TaxID=7897 RepID=H3B3H9_LATCH